MVNQLVRGVASNQNIDESCTTKKSDVSAPWFSTYSPFDTLLTSAYSNMQDEDEILQIALFAFQLILLYINDEAVINGKILELQITLNQSSEILKCHKQKNCD